MLLIEQLKTYTLPELAKKEGVKGDEYKPFVERVIQRVNAGELELVHLTCSGWKIPAVRRRR